MDPLSLDISRNLSETLNRTCHCSTLDRAALARSLEASNDDMMSLQVTLQTRPHLFSSSAVFVTPTQVADMQRIVRAVEIVVALPAYREWTLLHAPAIAHIDPGARCVFLGYDFHLSPSGARLIEINTNAGGALLNAVLGSAQLDCCATMRPSALVPTRQPDLEGTYLEMFRAEWRRARGDTRLTTIAIVDDKPAEQYLYPEFVLFERMFRRHGLHALIVDATTLEYRDKALWRDNVKIDLVYNRLTDFYLDNPAHTALRAAYLNGHVVLTPHPRAYALYADKGNLTLLSDPAFLRTLGVGTEIMAQLATGIPRTVAVDTAHAPELWSRRRELFFKPVHGYGAKAAYRGDKLTRRIWQEILAGNYIAQETIAPSERTVQPDGLPVTLKLDVRNYVYDGQVQLLAARLYQGQTTNFRTPGGGFAPVICPAEGNNMDDCAT